MCLSSVYGVRDGREKLLCEHTTSVALNGSVVTFTDIMGDEIAIEGIIKSIDLVKNIIKIEVLQEDIADAV